MTGRRPLPLPVTLVSGLVPGLPAYGRQGAAMFLPSDLGTDLLGAVDFGATGTLTLDGGAVSAAVDTAAEVSFAEGFASQRPAYDPRGFALFDGIDDRLTAPAPGYPIGSNGCEIISVARQDAPSNSAISRTLAAYGDISHTQARGIYRYAVAGPRNDLRTYNGANFNSNNASDFSGAGIVRARFETLAMYSWFNETGPGTLAHTAQATLATRARIGANSSSSIAAFWQGGVAALLVTNLLDAEQWAALTPWLAATAARFD